MLKRFFVLVHDLSMILLFNSKYDVISISHWARLWKNINTTKTYMHPINICTRKHMTGRYLIINTEYVDYVWEVSSILHQNWRELGLDIFDYQR